MTTSWENTIYFGRFCRYFSTMEMMDPSRQLKWWKFIQTNCYKRLKKG